MNAEDVDRGICKRCTHAFDVEPGCDDESGMCYECEITTLEEQVEKLRSALEFYANSTNYAMTMKDTYWVGDGASAVYQDYGQRAKIALNFPSN